MITFHIGMNKTGSSVIQDFLFNNRDELRERGVLYPEVCLAGPAHHGLASYLDASQGSHATDEGLAAAVDFAGDVVFSSEALQMAKDLTRLRLLTAGQSVRVIVYLRDPVRYLLSWWQEDVKSSRVACGFETYAMFHWRSFYSVLRRWADAFGDDAMVVRLYDRNSFKNRDILHDFLSAMEREELIGLPRKTYDLNPSVSGNLLFAKLLYNALGMPDAQTYEVAQGLTHIASLRPDFSAIPTVSEELAASIHDWYGPDLDRVAADFALNVPISERVNGTPVPNLDTLADDLVFICDEASRIGLRLGAMRGLLLGAGQVVINEGAE
jgi:hypothetical protein